MNHETGNESQLKGKQMDNGLLLMVIGLLGLGGLFWWAAKLPDGGPRSIDEREADNTSPKLIPKPLTSEHGDRVLVSNPPRTVSNDINGIAEQIRQQEQTNKHLQKLISDFFWFRIGIVSLLVIGAIFGSGGFN